MYMYVHQSSLTTFTIVITIITIIIIFTIIIILTIITTIIITIMINRSGASVNLECRANGNPSPTGFHTTSG